MAFYTDEKSQIHKSYLLKEKYNYLFCIRLALTIYVHGIWWTQIYDRYNNKYTMLPFITNLKYLTICGSNVLNLYFLITIVDMIRFMAVKKQFSSLWKFQHYLFQLGFSVQITIFLFYWVGVYLASSQDLQESKWYMFTTINNHGGHLLVIYIEFLVNNIAFKWRHLIPIAISILVYMVDNLIVTLVTSPVYNVMNWVSFKGYLFAILAVGLTFLHFYFAKVIYEKFKLKRIQALDPSIARQTAKVWQDLEVFRQDTQEQQFTEVELKQKPESNQQDEEKIET